ncbi:short chain dehydrogenase [Francisella frigiditurris]|uniref:Short chain dehydrogenase family protein n=1 Tax=Francisella frigiditurris TaxID=1542390 RepID=A0A1J0KV56_9GAMM|nr:short chain dehydrogenase [Francisella frigiditurris]APC97669.1 short chain dehydrogenase family protein [Francisella frigiditurris]
MSKKIVLIGASGVIGSATYKKFIDAGYEVIPATYSGGNNSHVIDIEDVDSIKKFFEKIGQFDALVSTTGKVAFKPVVNLSQEDWNFSFRNKLLGQINLVQIGANYIKEGGSFTLTTGILNVEPIALGTVAATVNGAIEAFVKAASLEYKNFRINVVSPTVVKEALESYGPFFVGYEPVEAEKVANAYLKAVAGVANGSVLKVGY